MTDVKSQLLRNRVPPHNGLERHGLRTYNVNPEGGNLSLDFFTQPQQQYPTIINGETPIASIGSCFAVEIKKHLQQGAFNFISTRESRVGAAEWGRVYTTKSILQIFKYSFAEFSPEIRICRTAKGVIDPYREGQIYPSEQEAEEGIARHYVESRATLSSCQVLIITPGQNEAWVNKSDGLAWVHKPPPEAFATFGDGFSTVKRFSLDENINNLCEALRLLWANNPTVKVIFTLSPVPSWATFNDANVVVRSFENKAILLLAIKEVVDRNSERSYYFPSFEMAMLSYNLNLELDNRHVKPKLVNRIMDCFDACFVATP